MLAVLCRWVAEASALAAAVSQWLWQMAPFPLEGGRCVSPHTGSVETAIRGSQVLHNAHLQITPHFLDIEDAVFDSFQTSRLLLVFLHSELSSESRQTLQRILQCSQVTLRLQREFSFFAMSVLDERTHVLPSAVSGAQLPCLAVFAPVGGEHGLVHVATMEGAFSINELDAFINDCTRQHGVRR
jgi:hypothetical protein